LSYQTTRQQSEQADSDAEAADTSIQATAKIQNWHWQPPPQAGLLDTEGRGSAHLILILSLHYLVKCRRCIHTG